MPLKMTVGQREVAAQWGGALQSGLFHLCRGCRPQVEHEIRKINTLYQASSFKPRAALCGSTVEPAPELCPN